MRLKILKISHDEAISAFIKGLRFHEALRNKLLCKRPTTMAELLATAKNYADAMTRKSSSEKMREALTNPLDGTTVVVVLTTGTIVALTTATIEKVGTGGVTIVMTSGASAFATTTTR